MSKSSYTDEEFRQILQTLFQEKKKNKENEEELAKLRSELSEVREKTPSLDASPYEKEIAKFKQMMHVYKQKYEAAVSTPASSEDVSSLTQQVERIKELLKDVAFIGEIFIRNINTILLYYIIENVSSMLHYFFIFNIQV